jgi:hypothetical protein
MANFDDYDTDQALEDLNVLLDNACDGDATAIEELESHLKEIGTFIKDYSDKDEMDNIYVDIEYEIVELVNDADWREDESGPNAIQNHDVLRLIYKYIAAENENVEVLLACNPHIPEDVLKELMASEFYWEEDGTQQALARNRKEDWVLRQLAGSDQDGVRYEVALNPHTPAEVLDSLAGDVGQCDWRVGEIKFGETSPYRGFIRWALIQNPGASKEALVKIAEGQVPSISPEVDEILQKMAKAFSQA